MASADFLQFAVAMLRFECVYSFCTCRTSSGKLNNLRLIYLPHLRFGIRAVWDFALHGKLVRSEYALYAIPVRQIEVLPVG